MRPLAFVAAIAAALTALLASPALAATARPRFIAIYSDVAPWCAGALSGGGPVSSVPCNKGIPFAATRWARTGATFRTRTGGRCLADASGAVVTRRCDGRPFQAWTQNPARQLVNRASGQCLTVPSPPGPLTMAACAPGPSGEYQWWNLERPQAA
jgi:hypothetical protein